MVRVTLQRQHLEASPGSGYALKLDSYEMHLGSGEVVPGMEECISQLVVGQQARCRLALQDLQGN